MENFYKSNLKSGMVVEMRDGNKYLVVDTLLIGESDFDCLDDYNCDLTNSFGFSELDLVKVYEASYAWARGLKSGIIHGDILWERTTMPRITLTKKEVAQRLGINPNLLDITD